MSAPEMSRKPVALDIKLRLPAALLEEIDEVRAERALTRAAAIRDLIWRGVRARHCEAERQP